MPGYYQALLPAITTVLGIAMAAGLGLAIAHWRGSKVSALAWRAHASAAVLGVIALAAVVFATRATPLAVNAALLCFAFALIGGVFNGLFRLQGERPPPLMIALHASAAVVGLVLLIVGQ